MPDQKPLLDRKRLRRILTTVLDCATSSCPNTNYRLCGTAAALLHGVDLPVGDIDLLLQERQGVDAFAAALSSYRCLVSPTWLPEAHQYYGSYEITGVEVQLSTVEVSSDRDTSETCGRGPWEHFSLLPCGPYSVPTVALELRLHTELRRNRSDRYRPILSFLQDRGCDHDLLRRCLSSGSELPQEMKQSVIDMLQVAPDRPQSRREHL